MSVFYQYKLMHYILHQNYIISHIKLILL